jgi:hypothetical protein
MDSQQCFSALPPSPPSDTGKYHLSHRDLKDNPITNWLNILSDDMYRQILTYLFYPPPIIRWWLPEEMRWNPQIHMCRCCRCYRTSKTTGLSYRCEYCSNYNQGSGKNHVCNNQLVCWDCSH